MAEQDGKAPGDHAEEDVRDAEVVEERTVGAPPAVPPTPGTAIEAPTPAGLAVKPGVEAPELVARLDVIREAADNAMEKGVDYGVVPGTDKPTLFKPGAEKLSVLFQLDVQPVNEKMWEDGGHLTVVSRAEVFHAPTGVRLGRGEGLCSTREKKYGKRKQDRACPKCGAEKIKRSKYPPRDNPSAEPGWYCFEKIGGCGANFAAADESITSQSVGEVENPDLPDTWNTVVKMAEKRARVNAVLAVTGASALFTQDLEDTAPVEGEGVAKAGSAPAFGDPLPEDQKPKLLRAVAFLLQTGDGPNEAEAAHILNGLEFELGYFPKVAGTAITRIAVRLRELEPDPDQPPAQQEAARQDQAERADPPPPSELPGEDQFEPPQGDSNEDDIPF